MKKIYFAIIIGLITAGMFSCAKVDILDPKTTTDLTKETVFADSARTMDFLAGVYAQVHYTFSWRRWNSDSGLGESGDEANGSYAGPTINYVIISTASLSPLTPGPYSNAWYTGWSSIRAANVFLANVDKSPISDELKKRTKAEARCLRAWYYSVLIKNFGGVPLIGDRIFEATDDFNIPRDSYEDCVNYINSELDEVSNDLPLAYAQAADYGRVTKGVCKGIKSRVLLYAASPLFNGGNIGQTPAQRKLVGYENYDESRWQKAADAAKDVMNLGIYSLYEDNKTAPGYGFSKVFLMRKNSEFVFTGTQGLNKVLETNFAPRSRSTFAGTPRAVPSQNLAEAFGMSNGKALTDPASGFDSTNPFINRDPRFGYTFIYNGTPWYLGSTGNKQPVYTYNGAPTDGFGVIPYSTGYFWRKMMDDNTSGTAGGNTERCIPLIRYAEILMNYAEAKNELGDVNAAYDQLKLIRKRAGIIEGADGMYGLKAGMTKEQMRACIQNEKMVEFAWEDHRYFDVRRWKTAMENQNITLMALKIDKVGAGYKYSKVPVAFYAQHVFMERNYFFPILQAEISKSPALLQNPGY
ncbi:RagB/SusD family nutrient uptake outer membrane protein [Pinibacter soli]|uniref:RagB/SusD family nutrient uptake outer membrane protein n=1 Tax=Pinibacter soli TaxID=3044211 RepID=A0ABT6R735_9BACT|nr:RagB/SusD family nutrient uptake outer membrane protein [Pinibacter soli]MDI3318378.1 RagB/SusD family nutrient uptake outer membrane protein [Pinibacter soli]